MTPLLTVKHPYNPKTGECLVETYYEADLSELPPELRPKTNTKTAVRDSGKGKVNA